MYLILIFCVIVHLAKGNSEYINVTLGKETYEGVLKVNDDLRIRIEIEHRDYNGECNGVCKRSSSNLSLDCITETIKEKKSYINVAVKDPVSKEFNGDWNCSFYVNLFSKSQSNISFDYKFNWTVKNNKPYSILDQFSEKWFIIASVVIVLQLIIIVQAICIIHFKRKARRATPRLTNLTNSVINRTPQDESDKERYIQMPEAKKMDFNTKPTRAESGIYEVLEPYPKPEPPPITSLPRRPKNKEPPMPAMSIQKPIGPYKPQPPLVMKKPVQYNTDTVSSTSSERSRYRPPIPFGIQDIVREHASRSLERSKTRPPLTIAMQDIVREHNEPSSLERNKTRPPMPIPFGMQDIVRERELVEPGSPSQSFRKPPNVIAVLPSEIAAAQLRPVRRPNQNSPVPIRKNENVQLPQRILPRPWENRPSPVQNAPDLLNAKRPGPPVTKKPPAPLPIINAVPSDNASVSSDDEEWTYEALQKYEPDTEIYENVSFNNPRVL